MNICETLEANLGNTVHLILKAGEEIPAGILNVNLLKNMVTFINGQGLAHLKKIEKANRKSELESEIIKNPNYHTEISISQIVKVI